MSFDSNGGSAVAPQIVAYNGTATLPTAPTKTENTFAGWYSDAGLTSAFSFSTAITANITLYAKWLVVSVTGSPPNGTGTITASLTGAGSPTFSNTQFIGAPPGTGPVPPTLPAPGVTFPYGMFSFTVSGVTQGGTVSITLTYPQPLPSGTQYWKYSRTSDNTSPHWYVLPSAVISGNTVTFSITDGGLGDDDLTSNGTIVDPSGPALPISSDAVAIPTLGEWALALLALLLLAFGGQRVHFFRIPAPAKSKRREK